MTYIQKVEELLREYCGRKYGFLTGRGTTAIYVALEALAKIGGRGKVVIPAAICPSVPNAVLYSGFEPIFCDISISDFNMDPGSVRKVIETEDNVKGVIAVHLFGQATDMDEILKIAEKNNLFIIEDVAQALGGRYKNKKVGSFGDISIFSFGYSKIIDNGRGGALLTDDSKLEALIKKEIEKVPKKPENLEKYSKLYKKVYYTLQPLMKEEKILEALFLPMPNIFKDIYLYQIENEEAEKICSQLANLEEIVVKRRRNALEYEKRLRHPDIIRPRLNPNGVPWRYNFLLKTNEQKEITEAIRGKGVDVSNWYPPLHRWYDSGRKQDPNIFVNSVYVGNHIINLWTEPSVSIVKIKNNSKIVLDIINKGAKS